MHQLAEATYCSFESCHPFLRHYVAMVHSLLMLQVYTTKQWAIMIVQSYPYLPTLEFHFETMASERGEPSRAELLANAQTNTMAAEWRHLNKYLEVIASSKTHDYIPLSEKPVKSLYPADASMSFGAEAALNLHYMMA